jgi:hypothetical protein
VSRACCSPSINSVGENDASNAERCELRPQAAHHFRPWQREQQIHWRPRRRLRLERASQADPGFADRRDDAGAERAIDDSDPHCLRGNDVQHRSQVLGAGAIEHGHAPGIHFRWLKQDQIQACGRYALIARVIR